MTERAPRRLAAAAALAIAAAATGLGGASASASGVDDFEGSWAQRALASQYELGSDVGFDDAPLLGTHNSFNSLSEMGSSLAPGKANQLLDLTDQLAVGVRSLELDLHPISSEGGAEPSPAVCHTMAAEGCTATRDLGPILGEIGDWLRLPGNSDQVVALYLEDGLADRDLHDAAASIIDDELGDLIYRPAGDRCTDVPSELTRERVRDAGKQIVIVSGCGSGTAWRSLAFSWQSHRESRPRGFEDFPSCGPDYTPKQYRTSLIRYYEESTRTPGAGNADDGITPATAAAMARCGVDLVSFDRLQPFDGRLEGSVWSWAPKEPSRGRCAVIRRGGRQWPGRWLSKPCGTLRARPACRHGRRWSVGGRRLDPRRAVRYCRRHRAQLAVPRTGFEDQLLRQALKERGARSALLGYRQRGADWVPLDVRRR